MVALVRPITDPNARTEAARLLRAGQLVAFPTETVYGLGADATDEAAVARIFKAKGRPHFNPLISHLHTTEAAFALGVASDTAQQLADAFWPGPLTLVLNRAQNCPIAWLTTAGLETVALRVPGSEVARSLLAEVSRPVAAPSANRSGRISPTTAAHVVDELDDQVNLILDGGPCPVGVESTVVDLSQDTPRLLRPGGVPRETIEAIIGPITMVTSADPITAPGMLTSHYAPEAGLRLNALDRREGEVFLDFGGTRSDADAELSPSGDLIEAAATLFVALRALDRPGVAVIAVVPIPDHGLGTAIRDRLARAAAPHGGADRI